MSIFTLLKSGGTYIRQWMIGISTVFIAQFVYPNPSLLDAVKNNEEDIVLFLFKNGQNLDLKIKDANGYGLLHYAILNGNLCILDFLLNRGLDVNQLDSSFISLLQWTIQIANVDIAIIECLLKHGADVNYGINYQPGRNLVGYVMQHGNADMVEQLLINNESINYRGIAGTRPLHLAVSSGQWKIVELLLAYGAHIWVLDPDRNSIFQRALTPENQNLNMIAFLCWFFAAKLPSEFTINFFKKVHDEGELLLIQRRFQNIRNAFAHFKNQPLSVVFDQIFKMLQNQKNLENSQIFNILEVVKQFKRQKQLENLDSLENLDTFAGSNGLEMSEFLEILERLQALQWRGDFKAHILRIFDGILTMIRNRLDELTAEEAKRFSSIVQLGAGAFNQTYEGPVVVRIELCLDPAE